jgi:hypothetical protein
LSGVGGFFPSSGFACSVVCGRDALLHLLVPMMVLDLFFSIQMVIPVKKPVNATTSVFMESVSPVSARL